MNAKFSKYTAASLALASLAVTGVADAKGFAVQQFNPAANQADNGFVLQSARTLTQGAWHIGALTNYADDPLILRNSSGDRVRNIISRQLVSDLHLSLGIIDRLELGVVLPVIWYQTASDTPLLQSDLDGNGIGVGDLRVVPKVRLFETSNDENLRSFGLALLVDAYLPTGNGDAYQGGEFRVEPKLAFHGALRGGTMFTINAGYQVRPRTELANIEVNDTVTYGVGVDIPVLESHALHILGEVYGQASVLATDFKNTEAPLEALVGLKYNFENGVGVSGGLATGVIQGFGAPDWRALLGIYYTGNRSERDSDGDGIADKYDNCPLTPNEDQADLDGDGIGDVCDDDIDGDGILNEDDACVREPEDFDGFEDEDGCPDLDHDKDGIIDTEDNCPLVANPDQADLDGDGIGDACDDDVDGDGIPNAVDNCPTTPNEDQSDLDGDGVGDACDPDIDGDGILNERDQCPLEPEDFDGFEDTDGCPEEGTGRVVLTCDAIEIRDAVHFHTNRDTIKPESFELLNQVADILNSVSYIRLVRVEGHTDSQGRESYNMDLSRRRAQSVVNYFVERGVDPSRLSSEGFGPSRPIADNRTSAGRAQNRRVEFRIVEQDSACRE